MTDTTNPSLDEILADMRAGADASDAAAADLEAEGKRITLALSRADALVAYILENAQSEELSTHIEISFEPSAAAMIANMAESYRSARAGETTAEGCTA